MVDIKNWKSGKQIYNSTKSLQNLMLFENIKNSETYPQRLNKKNKNKHYKIQNEDMASLLILQSLTTKHIKCS